jgi:hypothetical protein
MTKLYLFFVFFVSAVSLVAGPTITHNNSTYQLIDDKSYTWHEAKIKAEQLGGHLATITSKEENNVVFNELNLKGLNPWLGATDEGSEGNWRWITGETWNYNNWGSHGNDNANGEEHYLHFHSIFPGKWNDHGKIMFQYSCFILEIKHKQPIVKNSYTFKKFIPPGFSMLSIPFSHGQNTVNDIFGASPDFVIYEYTFTNNFFEGEWVINAYDSDFEEWDYPSHFLPAGTAVWILNTSFFVKMIEFTGSIPKNWKKSPPNPALP